MTELSDEVTALDARIVEVETTVTDLSTDVKTLTDEIKALKAAGGTSPADIAALKALEDRLKTVKQAIADVDAAAKAGA